MNEIKDFGDWLEETQDNRPDDIIQAELIEEIRKSKKRKKRKGGLFKTN